VVWASGTEFGPKAPPSLTHLWKVSTNLSSVVYTPIRLTSNGPELTEICGDWSPDDSKIVVEYSLHNTSAGRAQDYQRLAVVNRDGTGWTALMDNKTVGYNDYFAKWNPVDSNVILFYSDRNSSDGFYYYRFDTNNATLIPRIPPLASATGNSPSWASDGKTFYYEAFLGDGQIWMVRTTLEGNFIFPVFQIKLVNTVSYTGVYEFIQCVNGPNADYLACCRSAYKGDAVSITTDGQAYYDLTSVGNEVRGFINWMPDWK